MVGVRCSSGGCRQFSKDRIPSEDRSTSQEKPVSYIVRVVSSNKCHASSNKCLTTRSKKLVVTSATRYWVDWVCHPFDGHTGGYYMRGSSFPNSDL